MQLKNTYETLLTGKFKVLGHFADQALQSSSAYDLFLTICVYCIPSIHQEGIFSPLHEQWFQARNDYYTIRKRKKLSSKSTVCLKLLRSWFSQKSYMQIAKLPNL